MYAIIATGGKQYRVSQGDVIYVEKLDNQVGDEVTFPVLMLGGDTVEVGNPVLNGASVTGKVLQQGKSAKIVVYANALKLGILSVYKKAFRGIEL